MVATFLSASKLAVVDTGLGGDRTHFGAPRLCCSRSTPCSQASAERWRWSSTVTSTGWTSMTPALPRSINEWTRITPSSSLSRPSRSNAPKALIAAVLYPESVEAQTIARFDRVHARFKATAALQPAVLKRLIPFAGIDGSLHIQSLARWSLESKMVCDECSCCDSRSQACGAGPLEWKSSRLRHWLVSDSNLGVMLHVRLGRPAGSA